ncbi:hypothetical protein SJA_C1-01360 [Sphingobium indicum UT26S]|uniref:Uncharacterized protein n=1 Tax=Sphingobium indicum (strain DSM 16413 / CCM 7287 / MTCC 6362 / UT26 / NBRC 101211 / UT26S) TaxID=452662 RepID=D4YX88_SPHIU|nr:hypothetical protein SJA_C1-01360 [Sphingobium indicum UT26S]
MLLHTALLCRPASRTSARTESIAMSHHLRGTSDPRPASATTAKRHESPDWVTFVHRLSLGHIDFRQRPASPTPPFICIYRYSRSPIASSCYFKDLAPTATWSA